MIVTCEKCRSKFNLDDSLIRPTGSKVRCSMCKNVFITYSSSAEETLANQPDMKLDYGDEDLDLSEVKLDYGDENLDLSDVDLADEFDVEQKTDSSSLTDETIHGEPDLEDIKFDFGEEESGDDVLENLDLNETEPDFSEMNMDLEDQAIDDSGSESELTDIKIDFDDEDVVLPVESGNDLFGEEDSDTLDIENMLSENVADEDSQNPEDIDLELTLEPDDELKLEEDSSEADDFLTDDVELDDLFAEDGEVYSEDTEAVAPDDLDDELFDFSIDDSEKEDLGLTDDILDMKIEENLESEILDSEDEALVLEEDALGLEDDTLGSEDAIIENIDISDFEEDFSSLEESESTDEDLISPEEKMDILDEIESLGDLNEEVEEDDIEELDDIDEEEPEIKSKKGFSLTLFVLFIAVLLSGGVYTGIKYNYIDISKVSYPSFLSKYLKIKKNSDPYGNQKLIIFKENMDSRFVANEKSGKLFIITGKIKNNYTNTRNYISIIGKLFTTDKKFVQSKNVYAGNIIPDLELSNLNIEEIDTHLQNRSGDNKINSTGIEQGKSIPFMIVFSGIKVKLEKFTVEVETSTQK